jgi:type II secretory pathway pseudopilin PulG
MKKEEGFTVIEMVIFFVVLIVLAAFFVLQKLDLDASYTDTRRKIAANEIYYSLTDIYYEENGYFPSEITDDTLRGIDPELLIDPWDLTIGDPDSDYQYEGLDCNGDNQCQGFKLTVDLEKEDDYVREI